MTSKSGNLVVVNGKIIPIMFCALCEEGTKDSALISNKLRNDCYVILIQKTMHVI